MTPRQQAIKALQTLLKGTLSESPAFALTVATDATNYPFNASDLGQTGEARRALNQFEKRYDEVQTIIKASVLDAKTKQDLEEKVLRLNDLCYDAVHRTGEGVFDTLVRFFAARSLAPFLRGLADQLEKGGDQ